MTQSIFLMVLLAALIDAMQHLLMKAQTDAFATALAIGIAAGVVAVPVLAYAGLPDVASWPYLAVSICFGGLYWLALGWCYERGSLALVFPVSRGGGILMTTGFAGLVLQDPMNRTELLTVLVVVAGLGLILWQGLPKGETGPDQRVPALALACIIATYTIIDSLGVRNAGSAVAYTAALYIGNAVILACCAAARARPRMRTLGLAFVPRALAIGALSITTYMLILTAMQTAPIALVAALAETSIIFAALFAVVWLREPLRPGHALGVMVMAVGVVSLRLVG